ncbi:MAG: glutamate racemase [Anaerovoracaceae bacterium]|nr:glutamate racemase [Bacillota bacterium]MDY2670677.1 glutamate racemase [Anaerovoracaceae bacterium]
MNNGPVGVFDSGMGGISVLREIKKLMPDEKYIFYGDSKNAPYGTRTDEDVFGLTHNVFQTLMDKGVKAVVIACNTATSVAVRKLRAEYPDVPVIGMEPAIKPAVEENNGGRVVVMATPVTLRRPKFAKLMDKYSQDAEIIRMPAPGIVNYVEQGRLHDEGLKEYIKGLFSEIGERPADAVVLGCTHFPFVADEIKEAAGPQARLYNGNLGTARELRRRMAEKDLLCDGTEESTVEILNSAGEAQTELSWKLFTGELS